MGVLCHNEYYKGFTYEIGDEVKYRHNNVIYTLRCEKEPSVEPEVGDYWTEVEERLLTQAWEPKRSYQEGDFVTMDGNTFSANNCRTLTHLATLDGTCLARNGKFSWQVL